METPRHQIDFRYAPPSRWTCIGLPDDEHKSLVREDGALLYKYSRNVFAHGFDRVIEFKLLTDQPAVCIDQTTETARRAIVVTKIVHRRGQLTLQSFAYRHEGVCVDVVRWRIEAAPDTDELLASLWICMVDQHGIFEPADAPQGINPPFSQLRFCRRAAPQQDEPTVESEELALLSVGHPLLRHRMQKYGPGLGCICTPTLLAGRQAVEGAIVVPLANATVDHLDIAWVDRALAQARQYWDDYPVRRNTLQTTDAAVDDMQLAAARNILQAREIIGGVPEFQVGPTCYRGLWVVDGHFLLEAARYLGHDDEADLGLDALRRRVHDDGSIAEMPDHTKETGIALATLVRQTELSGKWERLRTLWPTVQNALKYIQKLRADAYALDPQAREYGLLPQSFPDGGVGGFRAEYTTTFWTLAGLKAAGRAASFLEFDSDAAQFTQEFDKLMADFRTHAQRDMQQMENGIGYLPQVMPGTSSEHHWEPDFTGDVPAWQRINPATATWALCQCIYPGEVFQPSDPVVTNLLRLLEHIDGEQGIPEGTAWLPYRAVWTYYASFAAHVWLYVGKPDKAIDYLYAFANHAAPTRVWREEQSLADSGHGLEWGDMPHNWGSAEFIRLVRHLLVFERGDNLELLRGLPAHWVSPARPLRVDRTPTRFGPVSLQMDMDDQRGYRLSIDRDVAWPAQPREVHLYVPQSMRDRPLMMNDQPVKAQDNGLIHLPAARIELKTDGH